MDFKSTPLSAEKLLAHFRSKQVREEVGIVDARDVLAAVKSLSDSHGATFTAVQIDRYGELTTALLNAQLSDNTRSKALGLPIPGADEEKERTLRAMANGVSILANTIKRLAIVGELGRFAVAGAPHAGFGRG